MFSNKAWILGSSVFVAFVIIIFAWSRPDLSRLPKKQPKMEVFTSSKATFPTEVIHSNITDAQEISLGQITGRSDAEMFGLVRNMSAEQRRMVASRLAQTPGNLAKIVGFFKAWSTIDSMAAFLATRDFQTTSQKEEALRGVFDGAEPVKASQLVDLLRQMEPGTIAANFAQELLSTGLSKWSEVDPQAAADFLLHYGDRNSINQMVYKEVGKNWARQDATAALAWKDKQDDPDLQQNIAVGIFQSWVSARPSEAAEYAKAHINDGINGLDGLVNASIVANSLADDDPSAAKAFVESLQPGSAQQKAALDAAMRLAHDDPSGTAAWVAGLPVADQAGAAGAVASQYAPQDPAGALDWINTLSGEVQDSALSTYALSARDRANGMFAALRITNDQKRTEIVTSLGQQWKMRDPVGFRQWLPTSGLPLETRNALLPGQ